MKLTQKNVSLITISYIGTRIVHIIVAIVVFLIMFAKIVPAQTNNCDGSLSLSLSINGQDFSETITLPVNTPTRYYIRVAQEGHYCQSNFEVNSYFCEKNTICSPTLNSLYKTTSPWLNFRSNKNGIARIDIDNGWLKEGEQYFRVRPYGTKYAWSNKVKIVFSSDTTNFSQKINLLDYIIMVPGYSYLYTSRNLAFKNPIENKTFLQFEEPVIIEGVRTIPWRFTKNSEWAYWRNKFPYTYNDVDGPFVYDGMDDLRWFIVDPLFSYQSKQEFNKYIWGLGDKRYDRNAQSSLGSQLGSLNWFQHYKIDKSVPGYNLGEKNMNIPYIKSNEENRWKVRGEFTTIPVSNLSICGRSECEVLRMDYFEGQGFYNNDRSKMINNNWFTRESWYFAKGIGLVQIKAQHFNLYANMDESLAPRCFDDSDCWADEIEDPTRELILTSFSHNPDPLTVQVSSDGTNYSSSIDVIQGNPYYVKLVNTLYTGYLETDEGKKWEYFFENGTTTIPGSVTQTLKEGVYKRKFRIWIPNESFPNEIREHTNSLSYSNEIAVNIKTPTPTPSFPSCASHTKGDADCNGTIDIVDITYWINTIRGTEQSITKADFNHDNKVDNSDFTLWLNNMKKL